MGVQTIEGLKGLGQPGLKGLSDEDLKRWDANNRQYSEYSEEDRLRIFKNNMFKEKFGHLSNYKELSSLSPEERDSIFDSGITDNINSSDTLLTKARHDYNNALKELNTEDPYSQHLFNKAEEEVKQRALKISNYYRNFNGSDLLPEDEKWDDFVKNYIASKSFKSQEDLDADILEYVQNTIHDNQHWYSWGKNENTLANAINSGAADMVGGLITLVGLGSGLFGAAFTYNDYKDDEDLTNMKWYEKYLSKAIDNEVTRFGQDVSTYNTIFSIDEYKKSEYIGHENVGKTHYANSFEEIFNGNLIPTLIEQYGFTAASIVASSGLSGASTLASKGVKRGIMKYAKKKSLSLSDTKKYLRWASGFDSVFNMTAVPAITGSAEGVIEGLSTKDQFLEAAESMALQTYQSKVQERAAELMQEILRSNPDLQKSELDVLFQTCINKAKEELLPKYEETLKQASVNANRTGIYTFAFNSAINGAINSTLKIGLHAPKVRKAISSGQERLLGNRNFKISGTEGNYKVKNRNGIGRGIYHTVKEPIGEGLEEYMQTVSSDISTIGGLSNLESFINNKYNGNSLMEVGDFLASDLLAVKNSLGDIVTSKEAMQSAVYGALGSIFGGLSVGTNQGFSNYKRTEQGKDGKYHTKLGFRKKREGEGAFEYITDLLPWRTGIGANIREYKAKKKFYDNEAAALEEWLNDSRNKDKVKDLISSNSWTIEMNKKAEEGNELEYRNKRFGKSINDLLMLEKLKGTHLYDTYIEYMKRVSNVAEGSKEAEDILDAAKNNPYINYDGMPDSEILNREKENAQKSLELLEKVQKESEQLNAIFGNIDEDVKEGLIYSHLLIEESQERFSNIEKELQVELPRLFNISNTSLSNEYMELLSSYGGYKKAVNESSKIADDIERKKEELKVLEAKETKTDNDALKIVRLKKGIENLESKRHNISKLLQSLSEEELGKITLSEDEIMSLPAEVRSSILDANESTFSAEQKAIIKNIKDKLKASEDGISLLSKVIDYGKLKKQKEDLIKEYNTLLDNPDSFNDYIFKAKTNARRLLYERHYNKISQIQNYKEFTDALDNITNPEELGYIQMMLSKNKNENYQRILKDNSDIQNVLEFIRRNHNISDRGLNIINSVLMYAQKNEIDSKDIAKVVDLLLETNEVGEDLFREYINKLKEQYKLDDNKLSYSTIEQVIEAYKKFMGEYLTHIEKQKDKPKEVVESEGQPSRIESKPEERPLENIVVSEEEDSKLDNREYEEETFEYIVELYPSETSEHIKNVLFGLKALLNNPNSKYTEYDISTVIGIIENIEDKNVDLNTLSTILLKESEDSIGTNENIRKLLSGYVRELLLKPVSKKKESKDVNTEGTIFDKGRLYHETPKGNPKATRLLGSNYWELKLRYGSNHTTVKYYDRHHVLDFIRDNYDLVRDSKIVFIVDRELEKEIIESMGDKYSPEKHMPIIAAIEHADGTLIANGKSYQPISNMAVSTNASGIDNINKIRRAMLDRMDEEGNLIFSNEDGSPIVSLIDEISVGKVEEVINDGEKGTKPLLESLLESGAVLRSTEVQQKKSNFENSGTEESKRSYINALWKILKNHIVKRWEVVSTGANKKHKNLSIVVDNLKGGEIRIFLPVVPMSESKDLITGKTILETVQDYIKNPKERSKSLTEYNSRIIGATEFLFNFFKNLKDSVQRDYILEENKDKSIQIIPKENKYSWESQIETFTKEMNEHLFLKEDSANGKYDIKYRLDENGKEYFDLYLSYNQDEHTKKEDLITSIEITSEGVNINKEEFIVNLLTENNGEKLRSNSVVGDLFTWQVKFEDSSDPSNPNYRLNIKSAMADNILKVSAETIANDTQEVYINSPFTSTGEINRNLEHSIRPKSKDNADNGNLEIVHNTQDEVVDSDLGIIPNKENKKSLEFTPTKSFSAVDPEGRDDRLLPKDDWSGRGELFDEFEIPEEYKTQLSEEASSQIEEIKSNTSRSMSVTNEDMKALENAESKKVLLSTVLNSDMLDISNIRKGSLITIHSEQGTKLLIVATVPEILSDKEVKVEVRLTNNSDFTGLNNVMYENNQDKKYPYVIKKETSETKFVPTRLKWGVFEGMQDAFGNHIDIEATMENFESAGITEEEWNAKSDEEKECDLDCFGVFK